MSSVSNGCVIDLFQIGEYLQNRSLLVFARLHYFSLCSWYNEYRIFQVGRYYNGAHLQTNLFVSSANMQFVGAMESQEFSFIVQDLLRFQFHLEKENGVVKSAL